ncbi:MAG TPA: BatD family protein [Candidatus Omnitrophota bacterium]|nr:BatD family protein [Candidatus Omnitrophota bacterium]
MKKISIINITLLSIFVFTGVLLAADAKFEANLDRNEIAIGESVQLGLTFYGTQSMPAPDLGSIDGLDIRYIGPSTMMTVINGQVSSSITHMYSVQALRPGKFQLGPFSFQHKNVKYSSNTTFLEVVSEKVISQTSRQKAPVVEKLNLGDRVFVTLEADKLAGYVNELIPITVRLFVNRMNVSDIQLPAFEQEEFSKVAFKEPKQYRRSIGGVLYDILEFKTDIFGTKPGDYKLGPAKLKCNVMVRKNLPMGPSARDDFFGDEFGRNPFYDDFFTRYERHPVELKSQEVKLVIQPLPTEGMPKDFSGAVGDYQFIVDANPKKLKVGDPITLNMSINGKGNFNTVIIPKVESATGFKVYEPQIKTGENTKEFKQVLIPETDKVTQIPALTFNYFNPYRKEYKSITQGPIAISVEKLKEEAQAQVIGPVKTGAEDIIKDDEGSRDLIYIKESPGVWIARGKRIYKSKTFAVGFVLPFVLLNILAIVQNRRNRIRSDSAYAGRIKAFKIQKKAVRNLRRHLRSGDRKEFYERFFKTLQDYLGNRLNIPAAGITYAVIESALASKEPDLDIMRKLSRLFEACDQAKFAQSPASDMQVEDDLKELKEIIGHFERKKI